MDNTIIDLIAHDFAQFKQDSCQGFYDWFCTDKSLPRRSKALIAKFMTIAFSTKFDRSKTYVFFKNNCPVFGKLYDDFRICDMKSGDVLYTVTPRDGNTGTVWSHENGFEKPVVEGNWLDVKRFFLNA